MKPNRAILITRPNHDRGTTYLYYWSETIIEKAKAKQIPVLDLSKNKAIIKYFQSYLKKHNPILIIFNGHGSQSIIAGYNNEILIEANKNEGLLENRIIYARCCDAAEILGKLSVLKGTTTFIGYKRKFWLVTSPFKSTQPLADDLAKLFLEPSNLIPLAILKGNTTSEACARSKDAMLRNLSFMFSTKASQAQKDAAKYMWYNIQNQVILGNGETTI